MRILIIDDHPIVASGCRAALASLAKAEFLDATCAESGEQGFLAFNPDISIIDTHLQTISGFELARRIRSHDTAARFIMYGVNDDAGHAARAIDCGAKGYVSKTSDPGDLLEAVRDVGNGGVYLPPAIARRVAFEGPAYAKSPLQKLTAREMEILRLLSFGKSLSEIAWLVHASYKTVANKSSIMRHKLGVRTSAELVRLAIESGIG